MADNLEVGLRVPPCDNLRALQEFSVRAEDAGIGALWLPDSQLLWRDSYAALAAMALATSRITLGTAVSNVATRHVSVIASAVRTLQEVAPNRVRLGLGTGSSATGTVDLPASTGAALAEAIVELRDLLNGGRLVDARGSSPIYIATAGPGTLERAARVADGVILPPGLSDASPPVRHRQISAARTHLVRVAEQLAGGSLPKCPGLDQINTSTYCACSWRGTSVRTRPSRSNSRGCVSS